MTAVPQSSAWAAGGASGLPKPEGHRHNTCCDVYPLHTSELASLLALRTCYHLSTYLMLHLCLCLFQHDIQISAPVG